MMTNLFSKACFHVLPFAFFMLSFLGINNLQAQKFSLQIPDTVSIHETFPVRFSIENADVSRFEAPYIKSLELVSGPNTSQNIKSINGHMTKSVHYTYMFRATKKGKIKISDISIATSEGKLTCDAVYVVVTEDGPENKTKQNTFDNNISNFQFGFGNDFFNQGFGNSMIPNMDMFRIPNFSFDFPDMSGMMQQMPNMENLLNQMRQMMPPNMQMFEFDMQDKLNPNQMPQSPNAEGDKKSNNPSKSKYPIYKI